MHYGRWRKHGDPTHLKRRTFPEPASTPPQVCTIEACDKWATTRGWCPKHYQRWRKYGDPLERVIPETVEERFWQKVEKTDECWIWRGALAGGGYGKFTVDGRNTLAHRYSYELLVGAIPENLQIDHLCRTRACVNPEHLEPVTCAENIWRSGQSRKEEAERQKGTFTCNAPHITLLVFNVTIISSK